VKHADRGPCQWQAMADLFALSKIQDEILFRNDEYVSPEKAKAIKRIRSVASRHAVCSSILDANG